MIYFILACAGITLIIVHSKLFELPRKLISSIGIEYLTYFIKCPMCVGFWVGFILNYMGYGLNAPVLDGAVSSVCCYGIYIIFMKICPDC